MSRNCPIIFRFDLLLLLEQNLFLIEIYICSISGHKPTLLLYRLLGGSVMRDVPNVTVKRIRRYDMQIFYGAHMATGTG